MRNSNSSIALKLGEKLTVGSMASRMKELGLSPESLAEQVPISNMTIRRLLKKPARTAIPKKHSLHIAPILLATSASPAWRIATDDLYEIVGQLHVDGAKVENTKSIKRALRGKFKEVGVELKNLAVDLWAYASARKTKQTLLTRSIAIGAILYFINPFDLIPDSIPVFGYLDDFAVMTLALAQIHRLNKSSRTEI